jgi:hypothetical protein
MFCKRFTRLFFFFESNSASDPNHDLGKFSKTIRVKPLRRATDHMQANLILLGETNFVSKCTEALPQASVQVPSLSAGRRPGPGTRKTINFSTSHNLRPSLLRVYYLIFHDTRYSYLYLYNSFQHQSAKL